MIVGSLACVFTSCERSRESSDDDSATIGRLIHRATFCANAAGAAKITAKRASVARASWRMNLVEAGAIVVIPQEEATPT
jgi:hypothetical protein